jgi:hypothetical protein
VLGVVGYRGGREYAFDGMSILNPVLLCDALSLSSESYYQAIVHRQERPTKLRFSALLKVLVVLSRLTRIIPATSTLQYVHSKSL